MALTDMVIMPGADYQAVCDAIREKTGSTGYIRSGEMAEAIRSISGGINDIGDGNTHIWVTLPKGRTSPMLGVCPNGTVTVDWGDGTEPDVLTGTSVSALVFTPNHNYAAPGEYIITLTVDGEMGIAGTSAGTGLLCSTNASDNRSYVYKSAIHKIEIGADVTLGGYAFQNCYGISSVVIPNGVPLGGNTFLNCYGLKNIELPDDLASIGLNAFRYCGGLASIKIPVGVTSIGSGAFNYCYSLASIEIPAGVAEIGNNAFAYCYSLAEIHFKATTPPTVGGSAAFRNIPTDCVIYVPKGSLAAYTSAANYPAAGTYTYVEE